MAEDNVVVVTGAAGGIGAAIAEALVRTGSRVVSLDREIDEYARADSMARRADVTSAVDLARVIRDARDSFGRIDGLVNAAGIYLDGSISEMEEADFDRLMAVNAKGTFLACRAVAPAMREQGSGSIVTISSIAAELSSPLNGAYGATKGAVDSLTRAFAIDLAPHGIRVNAIAPGPIATPMAEAALSDPAYSQTMLSRIALGRLGTPADVAGAVGFLLSDAARWITGSIITVDGGVRALR